MHACCVNLRGAQPFRYPFTFTLPGLYITRSTCRIFRRPLYLAFATSRSPYTSCLAFHSTWLFQPGLPPHIYVKYILLSLPSYTMAHPSPDLLISNIAYLASISPSLSLYSSRYRADIDVSPPVFVPDCYSLATWQPFGLHIEILRQHIYLCNW